MSAKSNVTVAKSLKDAEANKGKTLKDVVEHHIATEPDEGSEPKEEVKEAAVAPAPAKKKRAKGFDFKTLDFPKDAGLSISNIISQIRIWSGYGSDNSVTEAIKGGDAGILTLVKNYADTAEFRADCRNWYTVRTAVTAQKRKDAIAAARAKGGAGGVKKAELVKELNKLKTDFLFLHDVYLDLVQHPEGIKDADSTLFEDEIAKLKEKGVQTDLTNVTK